MTDQEAKKSILIIDDDPDLRNLLKLGLDLAGYRTFTAENGADAKAVIEEEALDILMVDLMMPVMDGVRFLYWLRREANLSLPAVVFTSSDNKEVITEATLAGATAIILKPFKLPDLLKELAGFIDR